VGPMKAGTTWIHEYLAARGDVCLPAGVKETFYFDRWYERGADWYRRRFRRYDPRAHSSIVEVAPSLFPNPAVPARVRETLGNIPIVFTLRDPVARSWSHYLHLKRYGYTKAPLLQAVEDYPAILEASRYREGIARWRDALPEAPFSVLWLEELQSDPDRYVETLCKALGIPIRQPRGFDLAPSNAAAPPPSFLLARAGRRLSYALRDAGAYWAVNAAKAMGLKRLFFGHGQRAAAAERPSAGERAWLREQLGLSENAPSGPERAGLEPDGKTA